MSADPAARVHHEALREATIRDIDDPAVMGEMVVQLMSTLALFFVLTSDPAGQSSFLNLVCKTLLRRMKQYEGRFREARERRVQQRCAVADPNPARRHDA